MKLFQLAVALAIASSQVLVDAANIRRSDEQLDELPRRSSHLTPHEIEERNEAIREEELHFDQAPDDISELRVEPVMPREEPTMRVHETHEDTLLPRGQQPDFEERSEEREEGEPRVSQFEKQSRPRVEPTMRDHDTHSYNLPRDQQPISVVEERNEEPEEELRGGQLDEEPSMPRVEPTKRVHKSHQGTIPRDQQPNVIEKSQGLQDTKPRERPSRPRTSSTNVKEARTNNGTKPRTRPASVQDARVSDTKPRTSHAKEVRENDTVTVKDVRENDDTEPRTPPVNDMRENDTEPARSDPKIDRPSEIVGGQDASVGEYPYFVDLNGCGGSLIAPQVVLSAAHCAPGMYGGQKVIVKGYDRGQLTNGAIETEVVMFATHPMYDDVTMANDIMLIQLPEPIAEVSPVTLFVNEDSSLPSRGQILTVIGVGNTMQGGEQSDILQELEVPAVSIAACNDEDSYNGDIIDEVMFCAGMEEGGADSCQGDSGGPIVIVNGNSHIQVGVVSWGFGCARPDLPGVYARTSSTMDWIRFVTCECWGYTDASYCTDVTTTGRTAGFECPTESITSEIPQGCELIPGWEDGAGDGCGWYELYESPGCPTLGSTEGTDGYTAIEACCHCQLGCELISGWEDGVGDSCGWYEEHDEPGCPSFGSIEGTDGYTAIEACCYCNEGGESESETIDDMPNCELIPGWKDGSGDGCDWYELYDDTGCPNYGGIPGTDGYLAREACCHCQGGEDSESEEDDADVGCTLVHGWTDQYGDTCEWYERNDHKGCPLYGSEVGVNGTTVAEACCICKGDGCELIEGFTDSFGDKCSWYEINEEPGCPEFGDTTDASGLVTAKDACCHCSDDGV